MPPTMSRPPPTSNATAAAAAAATGANGNGNVAASSADPFYVFKEELETKVSSVHQRYTKWKTIYNAAPTDAAASKDLPALTTQLRAAVASADKSLAFLEQTIVMVEANRSKFGHIDTAEVMSRRAFVATARTELSAVSLEVASDAVTARVRREERKLLVTKQPPTTTVSSSSTDDNQRFVDDETLRQRQLMRAQDASLDGLSQSVTSLNAVAVEIQHEVKTQNKMLDDLSDDVVETHERMNVVMDRMSRLLKTKDKCQIGLILFLVFVLIVMVFLVIYT